MSTRLASEEELAQKDNPVNRNEQGVFCQTEKKETENGERRPPEFTARSDSQRVSDREQVWIGKPVGVLPDSGSAVGAKVSRRFVGGQTAVAQRDCFLAFDLGRDAFIPRIRLHGFPAKKFQQGPQAETNQDDDGQYPDQQFRVVSSTAQLTETHHLMIPCTRPAAATKSMGSLRSENSNATRLRAKYVLRGNRYSDTRSRSPGWETEHDGSGGFLCK